MIQRKILKNGMTVVFKKRQNGVVSVAFSVRQGGLNEFSSEKGISHFVEHMLYKGTPSRNSRQISIEIERNGGELNGFTSEQITSFWCKMPSKHLDVALNVLSDMVKNPLFDQKEIDKERQVIFEEMKMYQDNPQMYVFDKIKALLYKGDFALPIIGTKESMLANKRDKLLDFFSRIYNSGNMILSVVGEADFDYICEFAEKNFQRKFGKINYPKIILSNGEKVEKRHGIDQANLVFAYHTPLPNDNKNLAAYVLNVLMASGMSSRLFSEIREKRNLAYAVKGISQNEKDYSYNMIYVGTTPKNVQKVKKIILEEFKKVAGKLDEKELNQVKEQIIGNYLLSQEDSHNIMINMLDHEIKGDAKEADKFVDKIKNIKLRDVKELARIKDYSFFALVPEE